MSPANRITDELRWGLLQKKAQESRAVRAFALFRENGVEPILIKGIAAGIHYPLVDPRISIDTDLAVSTKDYASARKLASSKDAVGLAIDLHRELRHLDSVAWDDLFTNSRELELDGGTIRILRPEDHLRILCVHWLTDGGSNRERLVDIKYAVEKRDADFDWDRFLNPVTSRRRRWLVCMLGIAERYANLDLTNTPVAGAAEDIPVWLTTRLEKVWSEAERDVPLEMTLHSPAAFLRQAVRRLTPDPVWATIQMEGSFDARTRFFYRVGNAIYRVPSSIRRITNTLRNRST